MNKKIKNKSNNNMNIANFCNDNINNKKYKKYYDFLNNPMNIFITTQYMKFLYTESIKNKLSKLIKENKNEIEISFSIIIPSPSYLIFGGKRQLSRGHL